MSARLIEKPAVLCGSTGKVFAQLMLLGVGAASTGRSLRISEPIATVAACEDEIMDYGQPGWPEPGPAEEVVERFKGQLYSIDGDRAHVTLTDSHGEEFVADCEARRLTALGVGEGDWFFCTVLKTAEGVRLTYEAAPRKEVPEQRQAEIRREVEDALTKLRGSPGF
jgi:hypothetical protein